MIKGCDWTEEGSLLLVSEQGGIPSAAFIELVSNTQPLKEEDPHHPTCPVTWMTAVKSGSGKRVDTLVSASVFY